MVIIAAVAEGLSKSSNIEDNSHDRLMKQMTAVDLVNFLKTPSCDEILDAVWRPRLLQDWQIATSVH